MFVENQCPFQLSEPQQLLLQHPVGYLQEFHRLIWT